MLDEIRIQKSQGTWVVRAGGAVLAETAAGLELSEPGKAPAIYFPQSDVAMAFVERSATRKESPEAGEASYFTIVTESGDIPDAAWAYETPKPGFEALAGCLTFDPEKVVVERL
ncbi:DUF427 domain-containing protein [Ostreiculturibacter nitratireducens]|uniref:DUF427 domain-containing protein n=1 Tax=Ostreiculturibacter nitratireducens TaxID=3075226 RepID=UPI0031B62FFA